MSPLPRMQNRSPRFRFPGPKTARQIRPAHGVLPSSDSSWSGSHCSADSRGNDSSWQLRALVWHALLQSKAEERHVRTLCSEAGMYMPSQHACPFPAYICVFCCSWHAPMHIMPLLHAACACHAHVPFAALPMLTPCSGQVNTCKAHLWQP